MTDWFANEEFWEASFDIMFPPSRWEQAECEVDQILALASPPAGPILDLACGPGRHTAAFHARGRDVTGVDRSSFLIGKAAERLSGADVEFVHCDMREFVRPNTYALACSLFTSFGYFDSAADNLQVIVNMYQSLIQGGVCLIDIMGKETLARIFQASNVTDTEDGLIAHQRQIHSAWTRIHNRWTLVKPDQNRTFEFDHWLYSGRELELMMEQSGFSAIRLYGDFDGSDYGVEARRLIAIGKKI